MYFEPKDFQSAIYLPTGLRNMSYLSLFSSRYLSLFKLSSYLRLLIKPFFLLSFEFSLVQFVRSVYARTHLCLPSRKVI